jgi:hypothetical protein
VASLVNELADRDAGQAEALFQEQAEASRTEDNLVNIWTEEVCHGGLLSHPTIATLQN